MSLSTISIGARVKLAVGVPLALAAGAIGIAVTHAAPLMLVATLGVASVVSGILFAGAVARSITTPLTHLTTAVDNLARGDVDHTIDIAEDTDFIPLARAVDAAFVSSMAIVHHATRVAQGDTSAPVPMRSDRDLVGQSLEQLRLATRDLATELGHVLESVRAGMPPTHANLSKFFGTHLDMIRSVHEGVDTLGAPIDAASQALRRVAARDLTARMTGTYRGEHAELQTSLNTTLDMLDNALAEVAAASEQVSSASSEISAGSNLLAEGSSQQADALAQVSSSLQELSSMTRQNASNAQQARALVERTSQSATDGVGGMRRLSEAMERIKNSSHSTAKIVKTIDEIAFQTNLLALNAAVEAARAGDAGRGFAVVADEVRNLAMRSAEAAQTTSRLIEEAVRNVESGASLNGEVLTKFDEISAHVMKVGSVMTEIATASDQQRHSVEQITTSVEQLNAITQHTAANSQESAATATELNGQAERMRSMVEQFTLTTGPTRRSNRHDTTSAPTKAVQLHPFVFKNGSGNGNGHGHASTGTNGSNGKPGKKSTVVIMNGSPSAEALIPFTDPDDLDTLHTF